MIQETHSTQHPKMPLPTIVRDICKVLHTHNATPILVGGCVRDHLLQLPLKDFDIEVFNTPSYTHLAKILSPFGIPNQVGEKFSVLKLTTSHGDLDFSLPREDIKTGPGHRGFAVSPNPNLSFKKAAERRDFTLNAIGYNPETHTFLDPYNGIQDLNKKILRHVSHAFSEDPLRVLRAMQFAARFSCTVHPETIALCQTQDLSELPKERCFEEFKKLFLLSEQPSKGLTTALELGILDYYPEIKALVGVPQDPTWHPEGDVWTHTLLVVDQMATILSEIPDNEKNSEKSLQLLFASLCHDLGKPSTTKKIDGRWKSHGHESAGVEPTTTFLKRLTDQKDLIQTVTRLVATHLAPALLYKDHFKHPISDRAIRRLSLKVHIPDLILLAKADHFGRTTEDALKKEFPMGKWLSNRAKALQVDTGKPVPLLLGRHLIDRGWKPGKEMGAILKEVYEQQLDGKITSHEEALEWIKQNTQNPTSFIEPQNMEMT